MLLRGKPGFSVIVYGKQTWTLWFSARECLRHLRNYQAILEYKMVMIHEQTPSLCVSGALWGMHHLETSCVNPGTALILVEQERHTGTSRCVCASPENYPEWKTPISKGYICTIARI